MNTLIEISKDETLGFAEALGYGGEMILIGMIAVFAVLGLIWALLTVFKIVFTNLESKKKAPKPVEEAAIPVAPVSSASDAEIVAVIAAAIAMAESECGNNIKFRVVSFKRK